MAVLIAIEAVVLALLALLVVGLLRSHAEILRALHDLGVGRDPAARDATSSPAGVGARASVPLGATRVPPRVAEDANAHDVVGVTPNGEAAALGVVGVEHPTLVAFLSSGCLTCHGFWDALADPASLVLPTDARVVVVTMGPEAESDGALRRLAPPGLPVVMSSEAWEAYGVPGSPYFVYVEAATGRVIGEGSAQDWGQVVGLMARAADDGMLEGPSPERGSALGPGDRRAAAPAPGARERRRARAEQRHLDGRAREARADEALLAAGIQPGHPSLYAAPAPVEDAADDA